MYNWARFPQFVEHFEFFIIFQLLPLVCRIYHSTLPSLYPYKMETILLQVAETQILNSFLDRPLTTGIVLIALIGGCYLVIRWLAKRYEKVESEKGELAKEVIKLMVNVENKMDGDKLDNSEIKSRLDKIIDLVQKWEK